MEIYRYMCSAEKHDLDRGVTVYNRKDWAELCGDASTSRGFSFGIGGMKEAIYRSRQLKGVVHADWLMIAEVSDKTRNKFRKCRGRYTDYSTVQQQKVSEEHSSFPVEYVEELCTEEYSKACFTKVRFFPVLGVNRFTRGFIVGANKVVGKKEKELLKLCNLESDYRREELLNALLKRKLMVR
jgi:hypothetical protein